MRKRGPETPVQPTEERAAVARVDTSVQKLHGNPGKRAIDEGLRRVVTAGIVEERLQEIRLPIIVHRKATAHM